MAVTSACSSRNGLRDWMVQRVTAVILALYSAFLLCYLIMHSPVTYAHWHDLSTNNFFRVASMLALLSVLMHAWIGMWIVSTDYIKCSMARLAFQWIVILGLLSCVIWGAEILWGM